MNKKCMVSAVAMFVMAWALSFVVHGWLLAADYAVTPGMRPCCTIWPGGTAPRCDAWCRAAARR